MRNVVPSSRHDPHDDAGWHDRTDARRHRLERVRVAVLQDPKCRLRRWAVDRLLHLLFDFLLVHGAEDSTPTTSRTGSPSSSSLRIAILLQARSGMRYARRQVPDFRATGVPRRVTGARSRLPHLLQEMPEFGGQRQHSLTALADHGQSVKPPARRVRDRLGYPAFAAASTRSLRSASIPSRTDRAGTSSPSLPGPRRGAARRPCLAHQMESSRRSSRLPGVRFVEPTIAATRPRASILP